MADEQAVLALVFEAENLAGNVANTLSDQIGNIGDVAEHTAGRLGDYGHRAGEAFSNALGNSIETLLTGGSLGDVIATGGAFIAGQLTETFGGQFVEKIAGSGIIAAVAAPLAALGTTIGGLISAAIPIGMALLPVILIGALVAAIAVLIANPEIRNKVVDFITGLVGKIGDLLRTGLGILIDIVPKAFATAFQSVITAAGIFLGALVDLFLGLPLKLLGLGGDIVRTIIGGLGDLGRQVGEAVLNAFANLHIDIGPFHISASGVKIDLPDIHVPGFATGVSNFAGGLAVVGEQGPELVRLPRGVDVIPNGRIRQAAPVNAEGVTLIGVSQRDLAKIIDRDMYFRLRRAGTGRA